MRTLVVWCPDWPVMAALADHAPGTPVAVLEGHQVLACSPGARAEGVRRGMRRRDAQSRCPELVLAEHRPEVDARAFEEVLTAVEELSAGVAPLRPGLCAVRVPSRFYGGEDEAAAVVAERLVSLGVWDVRLGVADSVFAAEQAARRAAAQDCVVVPSGQGRAFLAELPVEVLEDAELVDLLRRLGLSTLGAFASLPAPDVLTRFGGRGAMLHRLARGDEPRPVGRREVPPELHAQVVFEPPLENVEAIAFSVRSTAEEFVTGLAEHGLVCTGVRVEADVDGVVASSRSWLHPRWFGTTDLVDRVRWQLEGLGGEVPTVPTTGELAPPGEGRVPAGGASRERSWGSPREGRVGAWGWAGVDALRFVPDVVESLSEHADPLFGPRPDDRVERAVARVQGMVGHEGVVQVRVQGGRSPAARRGSTPWGERPSGERPVQAPWPAAVPEPAPATVFSVPRVARVVGAAGQVVGVDGRGAISCEPVRVCSAEGEPWQQVASWAGPWPVDEHWWDEMSARRMARFQVVGVDGTAWLMLVENGRWWTEARYD